MKIDKIVTMASDAVRWETLAMIRSLRAVGCQLQIWVIPYDSSRFSLPEGATWWEMPETLAWLRSAAAAGHSGRVMRKYQVLHVANFQYADSDVVFLRNPEAVLEDCSGFVTSCGHWHNQDHTLTNESRRFFEARTTTWQRQVFNSGQFACDRILYGPAELRHATSRPDFQGTCLRHEFHEQPGLNLLVAASGVPMTNLTLPPHRMESTWAGDYPADFRGYWTEPARTPYLIHWAGTRCDGSRPIDALFFELLTGAERKEWLASRNRRLPRRDRLFELARRLARIIKRRIS